MTRRSWPHRIRCALLLLPLSSRRLSLWTAAPTPAAECHGARGNDGPACRGSVWRAKALRLQAIARRQRQRWEPPLPASLVFKP